uniref:BOLA3 protein n=1 Tax=Nothoprocta perdicaria TaxID=30464 RepID=A0A8C6ZNR9_NOTPE
ASRGAGCFRAPRSRAGARGLPALPFPSGQGTDTGPGVTLNAPVAFAGGCGAMYEIHIESEEFREKRTVQQHRMVNQALSEEIKAMHGLRIFTSIPKA